MGPITWLPAVGEVIKPGGTLYKVSGQPVILMKGSVPAYRDLSEGVTDGPDVKELKANLVALGFDPSHQITINNTFDSATTTAVEAWQSSLGETQTGVVTLGDVVFLPSAQRITQVNTVLGSTGGASSASGSSSTTGASLQLGPAQAEFVSLVTTTSATTTSTSADTTTSTTSTSTTTAQNCPTATSVASAAAVAAQRAASDCPLPNNPGQNSNSQALQLQALIALLKAETAELRQKAAGSGSTPSTGSRSGAGSTGASTSGGFSGGGGGGGGSSAAAAGGSGGGGGGGGGTSSASSGSSGSGGGTAQAILQSTSTELVVTVDLDATKQTEAVVGEPVTVELPDGTTVDGKITEVSPVAQTSSSSSSSGGAGSGGSGSGSGGGSSSPSATIPVTIALTAHRHIHGLDQAAVSVNFEQQKARNVLSVPVTALIATAGGGYVVQEAAAPHRLLPVSPGLFAAGYVQISGSQITPGLQVTDSQG